MRTSIRRKFLTLSFAFFATMAVIVVAMAMLGKDTLVRLSLNTQLEAIGQAFDGIVAAEGDRALSLAEAVAAMAGVPEAFAAGDRDKLLALTAPAFERLRKQSGVEQMQFHTPTSHSFLRVHQPKKFGDDLSSFRTTVVAANREKKRISGLENGVAGFGIRGVVPVTHDGRHIGTFEMGMTLAEPFVRAFAKRVHADIAIFVRPTNAKSNEAKLLSSTSTGDWLPDQTLIAKALSGAQIVPLVMDQEKRLAVVVRPLLDFSGQVIGVSAIAIDRSTFDTEVTSLSRRISIAGLILFVAAMAGLNWLLMDIVRPLSSFRQAIEHVTGGRIDIAIEYTHRTDELGVVARAIDNLRSGIATAREIEAERQRDAAAQAEAKARTAAAEAAAAQRQTAMVESLRAALERVAKGDLTVRLTQGFDGSYRRIMDDFNTAIAQLESALGTVTQSARAIAARSDTMSSSGADLRARAEQQAATLEEISAELNAITSTGAKTAQGAMSAHQTVTEASADAAETGAVVEKTIHAMEGIERSSKEIMQIIGVIDEIAFQTNLLALNAGVEAARAGDAGRGFAVVAAEVRGLAQRSAEAAKQIKSLITASSREVAGGASLVREAGQSLRRILTRVDAIKGLVSEIGAGTREQANGLSHINGAIGQIDRTTQHSAAQVAEASESCGKLRVEATRLSELVAGFTLSESQTSAAMEEPRYARAG